jgi:hypothetical protein
LGGGSQGPEPANLYKSFSSAFTVFQAAIDQAIIDAIHGTPWPGLAPVSGA